MITVTSARSPVSERGAVRQPIADGRIFTNPALAGISFLAFSSAMTIGGWILAHQSGGAPKLDFIWPFDGAVYLESLHRYGAEGRSIFRWMLAIDMFFPISVAWFAIALLRPLTRHWRIFAIAPIAFLVLDWLENVSFFHMLMSYPTEPSATAALTSTLTSAKLASLAITYLSMLGGLVALARADRERFISLILALFATGGTILCLYLAPIQSTIWNAPDLTPSAAGTKWVAGALAAADRDALPPYYHFGRLVVWVYLALAAGFFAVRRQPVEAPGRLADERAFKVLMVLLLVAGVGNVIEYWGGSVYGDTVKAIGFRLLETPALGLAGITCLWLGLRLVHRRRENNERRLAWLFLLTAPAMVISTALLQYLPHGPLLVLSGVLTLLTLDRSRDCEPLQTWTNRLP